MKAAFIGMTTESLAFAKLLQKAGKNSDGIVVTGVICKNLEYTTQAAVILNVKAYIRLEDAINDCDVLFISKPESQLPKFSEYLKSNFVRNKVLCHFSKKVNSDILSCGTTNSCYSISFPYLLFSDKQTDMTNTLVVIEGGGKKDEEFRDAINRSLQKVKFCTKENKNLTNLARRFSYEYIKHLLTVAKHLFKIAGTYDEACFREELAKHITKVLTNDEYVVISKNANEIKRDMKLLNTINYSDTAGLFRDMEYHILQNSECSFEEKEAALRILKYKK